MTTRNPSSPTSRVVGRVLARLAASRERFPGRSWPTDEDAERLVRSVLRDTAAGVELAPAFSQRQHGNMRTFRFAEQVMTHRDRSAGANLARLLAAELWGEVEE